MLPSKPIGHPYMQHTTEHKEVSYSQVDKNWVKQPDTYTGDDLIDAFIRGKEVGQTEYTRVLTSQLRTNLTLAQRVSEDLFKVAGEKGFVFTDAWIKADGITNFNTLVVVKEEDFLDDRFREVYTIARKIKDDSLNENFHISFTFMPFSSNLNTACVRADGYFLKYDKNRSIPKPRKP